jgi:hypothetical protein
MKTFWLARDNELEDQEYPDLAGYNVFTKKPEFRKDGAITKESWVNNKVDFSFCPADFERVTGIKFKLGETREFRLAAVRSRK